MTKHSYREGELQRREEAILNNAEQLFLERGYANIKPDDIANVVGISKATLYQHFKSKDELVVKVLLRSYRSMNEFLAQPLDEPAIERLIAVIRRALAIHAPISIGASLSSGMRLESLWKTLHDYPQLADGKECFIQHLNTLVNKAKGEGNIDSSIPTPVVTYTLLALNRSLSDPILQAEFANNPEQLEGVMSSVIRVFLHGVAPALVNQPT